MSLERGVRLMGGVVILLSPGLAEVHSRNWLWLTALVGLNLLQSAMTNWCPAVLVLRAMGFNNESDTSR